MTPTHYAWRDDETGAILYDLDAIRCAVDLPDVVDRYTTLRAANKSNTEFRGPCPLHRGDGEHSFRVFYKGGVWKWHCYTGCKEWENSGDVYDFLMRKDPQTYKTQYDVAKYLVRDVLHGILPSREERDGFQAKEQTSPEIVNAPLSERLVLALHSNLDKRARPGGITARQWWRTKGLTNETIARFMLGFVEHCPTAYNKHFPDQRHPAYTIPITYESAVVSIRCRLDDPWEESNKYRPWRKGDGAFLFNRDSLRMDGSGNPRESLDVLIVEGEVKAMYLCQLGLDNYFAIISATAGAKSWLNRYQDEWRDALIDAERVYVLFDPDTYRQGLAERTARLFGRRGNVVRMPDKIDDYILRLGEDDGMRELWRVLIASSPVRDERYWASVIARQQEAKALYAKHHRRDRHTERLLSGDRGDTEGHSVHLPS